MRGQIRKTVPPVTPHQSRPISHASSVTLYQSRLISHLSLKKVESSSHSLSGRGAMGFWIFLAVVAALVIWAIAIYNGLVQLRNRFKNAFSQIDVQLKRRYDLIPNLVETVKGYI